MGDEFRLISHLKEIRTTNSKLTQEALAAKVDCSRQTIIALEQNKYNPSLVLALRISEVLNVPVEKLFEIESK